MYRILKSVVGSCSLDCLLLKQGSIVIEAGSKFTSRPASLLHVFSVRFPLYLQLRK
jgi:hypothetical protein